MLSRVVTVGIVLTMLALRGFFSSSSYQNSFQARMYYFLEDFEQAYALAKRAYDEDAYNKMASTILTQSDITLQYEAYIRR